MRKKLKWIALVLFIGIFGFVGYYGYAMYDSLKGFNKEGKESIFDDIEKKLQQTNTEAEAPPKWEGKSRVNVLLLGGDSRASNKGEPPRSDSLMIASIDPVTKKAALFSILRDTYVKIPGHGSDRINAALAYGGPNLAMKTVSDFTGLTIQYYVYTDFEGFKQLVDAVGGIDLYVEKDMKYSDAWDGHEYDIDLKQGQQHLDGTTALQYVRFRHDATSDFSRTERQRKFLTAVADKMKSTTSIIKLPRILQKMDPYIETNLTVTDMVKLASLGYEAQSEAMISQQLPPTDILVEKTINKSKVITVDPVKLKNAITDKLNGTDGTASPSPSPSSTPHSTTNTRKSEAAGTR